MHPDDRASLDATFQDAMRAGGAYAWTNRIVLPDGSQRYIHGKGHVARDATGRAVRIVGTVQDVTARHRLEETLEALVVERTAALREVEAKQRALIESVNEALVVTDLDDVILEINPQTVAMTGFAKDELVGQRGYEVLVPPEEHEAMRLRNTSRGGGTAEQYEQQLRRKDGTVFWALVAGSPMRNADGQVIGTVGAMLDITERKAAERVALRSQRLEAIGTLAGGIAHDLNNALTPVVMGFGELRERFADESDLLDVYEQSLSRASEMVRQLLSFSRGAAGERLVLRVRDVVAEVERLIRGTFPKSIKVAVVLAPDLPAVRGDATQLHQLLLNLCVNARDAMPGGGRLTVEACAESVDAATAALELEARPGDYVRLTVTDTGTGIPMELQDRVFEPFFSMKAADLGTGLGLSTAMGIARGHGGFLRLVSSPAGTSLSLFIPAERAPVAEPVPAPRQGERFVGSGQTLLLVDDEPLLLRVARMLLERRGFTVLTAADGADGLLTLAEHLPEVKAVIADLQMPRMDGVAFVRTLRQLAPTLPVAVASGTLDEPVAARFRELGVTIWLPKPYTETRLFDVLKRLLE